MKIKSTLLGALLLSVVVTQGQTDNGIMELSEFAYPVKRKNLNIPNVNGFQVLKCDFHMHTVFTDGHVWPNVRVQEAWREGLDAISYTEHMEYNPHSADVKVDHNRSHDLAVELAKENNILLVKGTEITRQTPPGHFNALFIQDANTLVSDNNASLDQEAIDKVYAQKAFIFWNHPGWQVNNIPGSYEWIDFVEKMYQEKKLHGIEVVNGLGFHKKALDWALDRNLTIIGNTDIHNLIAHDYDVEKPGVHRTMTLVMSKDRSAAGIREALEAGRTVAWSSNYLFGKEEHVRELVNACVSVSASYHEKINGKTKVKTRYYEIKNNSDLYFELELKEGKGTKRLVLYPESTQILTAEDGQSRLSYEIISTYIRSDKHLQFEVNLK
ncbi:Sb-PDE family phosphodiesterase [Sphingobacterium sp.]|uniref:Sb-PDE family phosphodiesterase n=1 Tax=Sphingobacterium sp. TaxID=341027 RepID=UPI0028AA8047|nr:Sb-PDE family phosphodiesterase [Sphingobacterium sp.]